MFFFCAASFSVTKIVEIIAEISKNRTESVDEYLIRIDGEFLRSCGLVVYKMAKKQTFRHSDEQNVCLFV